MVLRQNPVIALILAGIIVVPVFGLTGCSSFMMSSDSSVNNARHIELPSQWAASDSGSISHASLGSEHEHPAVVPGWIDEFHDSDLSAMVQEALEKNYDLKIALAKVNKARAKVIVAGAVLKPSASSSVNVGRRRTNTSQKVISSSNSVSVDLIWEVDVWGRLSSQAKASVSELKAAQAEFNHGELSLSANVAKAWFAVIETKLQVALVESRIHNLTKNQTTIEQEFELGLKGALDVYLARAGVQRERARLAVRIGGYEKASRTLSLLLGRYPGVNAVTGHTLGVTEALPEIDLLPTVDGLPLGLPSDLLLRRWDLIAWQMRLAAADSLVSAAHYNRFPRLSLTGSVGGGSEEFKDLLSSEFFVWSLLGGLTAPLFDGKRLASEETIAKENVLELESNYNTALLNAFYEVEIALRAEYLLKEQSDALEKAVGQSMAAEKLAFENYMNGLVSYSTVLESQRSSFDSQSAAIDVRNQQLQNRINLHLALGGSFDPSRDNKL